MPEYWLDDAPPQCPHCGDEADQVLAVRGLEEDDIDNIENNNLEPALGDPIEFDVDDSCGQITLGVEIDHGNFMDATASVALTLYSHDT